MFEITFLENAGEFFSLISGIHVVIDYFHFVVKEIQIKEVKHKYA